MAKLKKPDEALNDFLKVIRTIKEKSKEAEEKIRKKKEEVKKSS